MGDVVLVAGLSFGDEGKGSLVDHLARQSSNSTVVRYNGGAQAAHNVVLSNGRHHTFAQFGSGTFVPGCRTHLSRFMLVNPIFLMREELHLRHLEVTDAYERMTVERGALITNPFQVAANRLREMVRAEGRHGSCGMGIGETIADFEAHPEDALRVGDLEDPAVLRAKLMRSQERKHNEFCHLDTGAMTPAMWRECEILTATKLINACVDRYRYFASRVRFVDDTYLQDLLREPGSVVFEGAQGVLLDQDWGFFPYVTRSDTTFGNAFKLLKGFDEPVTALGVMRAYATRHGPGPFPTEDPSLNLPDTHNGFGPWQREFRFGHLDLVTAQYAIRALGGVSGIVMTNVDRLRDRSGPWKVCTGYVRKENEDFAPHGQDPDALRVRTLFSAELAKVEPDYKEFADLNQMINWTADRLRTPIKLVSYGPTAEDKRPWR